jgi:hypothetical protein
MEKKKLSTEDGSEFTVFYLKEQNKQEQESDIHAPVGWMGSNEIASYFEDDWGAFDKHKQQEVDAYNISIDDTIPSDLVDEPVRGRLYKAHSLGVIIRFVEFTNLEGVFSKRYARVSRHGHEFVVELDDLRKASEIEVEKYLEKDVD